MTEILFKSISNLVDAMQSQNESKEEPSPKVLTAMEVLAAVIAAYRESYKVVFDSMSTDEILFDSLKSRYMMWCNIDEMEKCDNQLDEMSQKRRLVSVFLEALEKFAENPIGDQTEAIETFQKFSEALKGW